MFVLYTMYETIHIYSSVLPEGTFCAYLLTMHILSYITLLFV